MKMKKMEGEGKEKKNTKRMEEKNHKKKKHKCQITCNLATHKTNNKPCNMSNKIIQKENLKGSNLFLFTRSE